MTYDYIHISNPNPAFPSLPEFSYPYLDVRTDSAYKALVDRFGFWKTTSLQGLLKKVSLPTGGEVRFTYGQHRYGEERRFRKVNTCDVELYSLNTSDQPIGGARLEKIETFSNPNTLVETQTYTYNKPGTNSSSGIFYNIYEIYESPTTGESRPVANPYNYGMINSHIGYSSVQQTTVSGGQSYKTIYTFDTGHTAYSSASNNPVTINRNTDTENYSDSAELHSGSLTYSPQLIQTGKLLAVEQYKGNAIQKATYYRYNGISNTAINLTPYEVTALGCTDTIVCLSKYSGHIARKLFVYPNVPELTVTYEYGDNPDNAPLISVSTCIYDSKLRKKEVTRTDSYGIKHFTRYTYPDDIVAGTYSPFTILKQTNQINNPVETISGYWNGNTEYITSGTINQYKNKMYAVIPPSGSTPTIGGGSVIIGDIQYVPYLYKTYNLALVNPATDYTPLSDNYPDISCDPRYRLTCIYEVDKNIRPVSVMPFGKTATTYTWNGIYPATKTIGNQTWTYTYIPYVGLQTMTDPRGIITCYTYDTAGRLTEIYQLVNGRKQILNAYQYHIKTE